MSMNKNASLHSQNVLWLVHSAVEMYNTRNRLKPVECSPRALYEYLEQRRIVYGDTLQIQAKAKTPDAVLAQQYKDLVAVEGSTKDKIALLSAEVKETFKHLIQRFLDNQSKVIDGQDELKMRMQAAMQSYREIMNLQETLLAEQREMLKTLKESKQEADQRSNALFEQNKILHQELTELRVIAENSLELNKKYDAEREEKARQRREREERKRNKRPKRPNPKKRAVVRFY